MVERALRDMSRSSCSLDPPLVASALELTAASFSAGAEQQAEVPAMPGSKDFLCPAQEDMCLLCMRTGAWVSATGEKGVVYLSLSCLCFIKVKQQVDAKIMVSFAMAVIEKGHLPALLVCFS